MSDLSRVFRLPGSCNRKLTPPLPVTVLSCDESRRYNQGDISDYFIEHSHARQQHSHPTRDVQLELKRAAEALRYISAEPYEPWLKIGMAVHSVDPGEAGFTVWDQWSATCTEKYNRDECRKKWESFHDDREDGITIATLFDIAIKNGWSPNGNGHAKETPPWPGDKDMPRGVGAHDVAANRYEQEERAAIQAESIAAPQDQASAYPCPDALWQGIFARVADLVGRRSWEVWTGTYAALSAVAHRNLHWFYYSDPIFGMSYTLLLGPTGAGKNLVVNTAQDLLPEGYSVFFGVQSGPGLVPLLTDESLENKTGRLVVHGRPALFVSEEWSRLLQVAGIEHSTLVEDLNALFQWRRAWSQSRSHKLKSGGNVTIINPTLTICGTSTIKLFTSSLSERLIFSGYLNRYLILPGESLWEEFTGQVYSTSSLHDELNGLRSHAWGHGQNLRLAYSDRAWERWLDLQRHFFLPVANDPDTSEVMKRLHFYFHHVALIYAWSAKSPAIEMDHLKAAVQVISTSHQFLLSLLETQHAHVEPPPFQRRAMGIEQRILAKINREPGIAKRKLMQDLNCTAGCEELGKCLESLLKAELIISKPGSRKQVFLFLVRGGKC